MLSLSTSSVYSSQMGKCHCAQNQDGTSTYYIRYSIAHCLIFTYTIFFCLYSSYNANNRSKASTLSLQKSAIMPFLVMMDEVIRQILFRVELGRFTVLALYKLYHLIIPFNHLYS